MPSALNMQSTARMRDLLILLRNLDVPLSTIPARTVAVHKDIWTPARAALMPRLANLDAPLSSITGASVVSSVQVLAVDHNFTSSSPQLDVPIPVAVDLSRTVVLPDTDYATDSPAIGGRLAPVTVELETSTNVLLAMANAPTSSSSRYRANLYVVEFA